MIDRITFGLASDAKAALRDSSTSAMARRSALITAGAALGDRILGAYTSSGAPPRIIVVTSKPDAHGMGIGLTQSLDPVGLAIMDFGNVRGAAVLNAPVRDAVLPDAQGPVDLVVVGKTILVSGCTAVSLAKEAVREYMPRQLAVASVFHTTRALEELHDQLHNADLFLIGDESPLSAAGTVDPPVLLPDEPVPA